MTNFMAVFVVALAVNCGVTFRSSDYWKKMTGAPTSADKEDEVQKKKWETLLRKYLIVYLLATLSDWLQGPYVYALYSDYKYSQHDIAVLFVAGFGSSMIFGSFVGGMADWGGRRLFVVVFALIYAASCVTKHFKEYKILMLGRLLGGVATSLLFSVFEAWLIRSHADAGLKQYIGKSFSWAAYCNSIVAISSGLVANEAAASFPMTAIKEDVLYFGGYLTPFDISLCALVLCGLAAMSLWDENFGESDSSDSKVAQPQWYDGLRSAFTTTIRSKDILLCGIISSLFEGSMYIFVFMWTPALRDGTEDLPFGLIFSTFMVSCMAGSSLFSVLSDHIKGEKLAVYIFGFASASMGCVALSGSQSLKFIAMLCFEATVGMYWPIMGTMKGAIVPESKRVAIYNIFRIPLNFIVLFSLLTDLTPTQSFTLNCVMLGTASFLQFVLMQRREKYGLSESNAPAETEPTKPLLGPVDNDEVV
mmetsp:Transcript_1340/g.1805  ORF Transcript_1340/g.1805 Transcript_1340/m.1805 type:complete len:476 (-) Transcript_1340:205-1632(-)